MRHQNSCISIVMLVGVLVITFGSTEFLAQARAEQFQLRTPLPLANARVTTDPGDPTDPFHDPSQNAFGTYYAVDFGGSDLTSREREVFPAARGKVISVNKSFKPGQSSNDFGNYVLIDHENGYYTLYGHLDKVNVTSGKRVDIGENIGVMGDTGAGDKGAPHLHFQVLQGDKKAVDKFLNTKRGGVTYYEIRNARLINSRQDNLALKSVTLEGRRLEQINIGDRFAAQPARVNVATKAQLNDQIQKRRRQLTQVPQYLLTPSIATVWKQKTDFITGQNLVQRYDEFYYAALDYQGLANQSLNRARDYLNKGNIEKAQEYVREADRHIKLANMNNDAAIEVHRGHLSAAATLADGIYQGSKAAVSFGGQFVSPGAAKVFDGLFQLTDFAIEASDIGIGEAAKNVVTDQLVKTVFERVKITALGDKTLAEALSKATTQSIGSSRLYSILDDILKNPELEKAIMKALADKAASQVVDLSEEQAKKIVNALISSLGRMKQQHVVDKRQEVQQANKCPETKETESASKTYQEWKQSIEKHVPVGRRLGC